MHVNIYCNIVDIMRHVIFMHWLIPRATQCATGLCHLIAFLLSSRQKSKAYNKPDLHNTFIVSKLPNKAIAL